MMPQAIEAPVVQPNDRGDGERETHPAYGQITVHRTSGRTHLYGSDFLHHQYVSITVFESELHRSLSRDWPFQRRQLLRLTMSEAQWATFVSSFNQGSGVQCTLEQIVGSGPLPGLPPPNRTDKFQDEASTHLARIERELHELRHKVVENTSGLSKAKASDLLAHVDQAIRKVNDSLPFVAKSMREHMEGVVEAAKSEVHGYISHQINRAGLQVLTGAEVPLALESSEETERGKDGS